MTLRVLLDTTCLADGRRAAGIGRYAVQIQRALGRVGGLELRGVTADAPPSEARPVRYAASQGPVLATARDLRPHVLHGLGGEAAVGFPVHRQVVTLQDVEMWRMPVPHGWRGAGLRAHRTLQARLLRGVAVVITPSRVAAEEAVTTLGLDPDRIHVIGLGAAPAFVASVAPYDHLVLQGAGVRREEYVLWVGSLRHQDPRKGLGVLFEALARLGDQAPPLAMVGVASAEEQVRLRDLAHRHHVRLTLCGPRSDTDLAALYRHALGLVISSRHEGFGLPALEAMACGCAVTATRAGNLPDLIGDAGGLVPPDDPDALAEDLRRLTGEPLMRARRRHAGTVRAAAFSWDRAATATAAVYWEVARHAASRRSAVSRGE